MDLTNFLPKPPCIMCSVHWGDTMSTSEGYHEYNGGCSVHRRDIMSTSGGYHEYIGGYHGTCGGIS